ncbi:hypothetical protein QTN25_004383 [Entamoeba marina]
MKQRKTSNPFLTDYLFLFEEMRNKKSCTEISSNLIKLTENISKLDEIAFTQDVLTNQNKYFHPLVGILRMNTFKTTIYVLQMYHRFIEKELLETECFNEFISIFLSLPNKEEIRSKMIQIGESIINSTKYIHMFEPKHFRLIIETFIGQCDTAPSKLKPRAQILLFKFIPKVFDAIADDFDHAQEYFDLIGIEVIPVIKYYLDSNTKEEYLFDLVSNLFTNFYRSPEIQTLFNYLLITLQNETNFLVCYKISHCIYMYFLAIKNMDVSDIVINQITDYLIFVASHINEILSNISTIPFDSYSNMDLINDEIQMEF